MKKSAIVKTGLLATVASAFLLAGCGGGNNVAHRVCVDGAGNRAPDQNCETWGPPQPGMGFWHWYYFSRPFFYPSSYSYDPFPMGSRVSGGSFAAPAAGVSVHPAGSISRGGFGSSAASVGA